MPIPPRPEEIRERLVALDLQEVPEVATQIPSDVLDRIGAYGDVERPMVEKSPFWRVTFISADFSEDREGPT